MRRTPSVLGSIGLPIVSTNPGGNAWNTTHDPPVMGSFGMNRSADAVTYNAYNMAPPYLGAVNSTNIPYAQQLAITAIRGSTYTYPNQNMYPSP